MALYKKYQGDSLWIDITHDDASTIDPVWTNWTGKWDIAATAGGAVLLSGTIARSATTGLFNLRIGPVTVAGWSTLPVGNYVLTLEINNTTVDYKQEQQHTLIINTQGII